MSGIARKRTAKAPKRAPALTVSISICIEHPRWKAKAAALRPLIRTAIRKTLSHEKQKGVLMVSVICADDARLRELNHDYRGKDKPTNVLSFPDGTPDERGKLQLGDVVLSMDTLQREAKEQGKKTDHHLTHLVVHSVLHLLGHDHMDEAEAEVMESKEIEILKSLKIKNPYL